MRALVLCVDRDDDIGTKAGVRGPVIGREDNLAASMKLGLVDPEDPDVNTMFMALSIYDDLIRSGQEAEIATVSGDARVGPVSDRALTQQLDRVLEEVKPDRAYLVSDGAEDESIFPMIASRLRVDHVRRVYVRQSPAIESTYYLIARSMKNPKIRRRILFPIGLALVVFAAIYLFNPVLAPAIVLLVVGLYALIISLPFTSVRDPLNRLGSAYEHVKSSVISGDFSIFFNVVALIFFLIGIFFGIDTARTGPGYVQSFLLFVAASLGYFILGVLCFEFGKVVTAYFKRGRVPRHVLLVASSFIALGLLVLGTVQVIGAFVGLAGSSLNLVYVSIGLAILLVLAGAYTYRPRGERPTEDSWRH